MYRSEVVGLDDMRVFVAGAGGAVGSRLVPLLVSAGHSVVGLTRTPAKAAPIRRAGAEIAVADALNRAAIVDAVAIARPDVIVHEMTSLSAANDLRKFDQSFAITKSLADRGFGQLAGGGEADRGVARFGAKLLRMTLCPQRRSGQIGRRSARP